MPKAPSPIRAMSTVTSAVHKTAATKQRRKFANATYPCMAPADFVPSIKCRQIAAEIPNYFMTLYC